MSGRPCIRRGHTDPAAHEAACRTCWLSLHDERYAAWHPDAKAAAPAAATKTAVKTAARGRCAHLGRAIPAAERIELKLAHGPAWFECDKGHGVVCPCGACKTCPDYDP